jgi:protein TonB
MAFVERKRKPRWGALLLVGALHVLALAGLMRALAPGFTATVVERATSLVTVTVRTPPPPPPAEPDEGAAAENGKKATPREVVAPKVARPSVLPAPRVSSTGSANAAGASAAGQGTGAGGEGGGTGSGRGGAGAGTGGFAVTRPVKIAGDINDARDYPTPPGGRQVRLGHSVTIAMTVGTDGRASNCRIVSPSPDPAADRLTCELAIERFRFRPATDVKGNPVPATYGWRQSWFTR